MNPKPEIAEKVLSLLRKWGWEKGLEQLKAEIKSTKDQNRRAPLHIFVAWLSGERDASKEAAAQFQGVPQYPAMTGWALTVQAFIALRKNAYAQALELLNQALSRGDSGDSILRATIHHCYGSALFQEGQPETALSHLHEAIRLLGKDHFATGRVLDTLATVYDGKDNLYAAREFYEKAIEIKQRLEDEAGIALSHGQLGRLYLDWGYLERAEKEFLADLEISERVNDARSVAQMYNFLGRVAYSSGRIDDAVAWLDQCIERSQK
ncbi:MAG TPA: tetratricopeptide repeat protein, partial [Blastocatellia bacterium]|nr:tetratricopeptide repeat protein [Blastocatellia bacterium]